MKSEKGRSSEYTAVAKAVEKASKLDVDTLGMDAEEKAKAFEPILTPSGMTVPPHPTTSLSNAVLMMALQLLRESKY